ncbi:MAG: TIR domain-containing protein [Chitinophagaceae bacterium]
MFTTLYLVFWIVAFIAFMPLMNFDTQSQQRSSVFISYAREDEKFVGELCQGLLKNNIEAKGDWLLVPGENYQQRLREFNLGTQAFLFIITPDSIKSDACLYELALAVEHKKQILPISRRDHIDDNLLDSALRAPQWTFLRPGDDFEGGLRNLGSAIKTDFILMEMHGRLLLDADNWNSNHRNYSYLLRKDGLKEAEDWLKKTSVQPDKLPQPTPLQVDYIFASQRARTRGSRIALGIAVGVIMGLMILAIVAWTQSKEANFQRNIADANAARARKSADEANREKETALKAQRAEEKQRQIAEQRRKDAVEQTKIAVKQRQIADAQRKEAELQTRIALARQLATQSLLPGKQSDDRVILSFLLALESLRRSLTYEGADALNRSVSLTQDIEYDGMVKALALSQDGKTLVAATGKGQIWHSEAPKWIWDYEAQQNYTPAKILIINAGMLDKVTLSPDGKTGAVASLNDSTWIFDALTGTNLVTLKYKASISQLAFSGNSRRLATLSEIDRTIRLWNIHTGAQEGSKIAYEAYNPVVKIALSFDGKLLATYNADGMMRVQSLTDLKELLNWKQGVIASDIMFSPDGKYIATTGHFSCWIRNIKTKAEVAAIKLGYPAYTLAFSGDSRYVAIGYHDGAGIWCIPAKQMVATIEHLTPRGIELVAFSTKNKNKSLITAGTDSQGNGIVKHWLWSPADVYKAGRKYQRTVMGNRKLTIQESHQYIGEAPPKEH